MRRRESQRTLVFAITHTDCKWQSFTAGGPGGQHQNHTQSGIRCVHEPSGAVGEARDERSQHTNRRRAFRRMAEHPRFQLWARLEAKRRIAQQQSIEAMINHEVDQQMRPERLTVEVRDASGRWQVWSDSASDDDGEPR